MLHTVQQVTSGVIGFNLSARELVVKVLDNTTRREEQDLHVASDEVTEAASEDQGIREVTRTQSQFALPLLTMIMDYLMMGN